ncbi:DUF2290 domain-containing protein [Paenibacillus sp. ACRRX]|uniref:DUF2290 domain-containing protein n=1 Tax=Paenibacillus sp. ACRRX TaxID=2918206 RepID=UPI001EF53ABC|nr:DUF2290 domain-containing protein [Paenibacillus sp. ACRRX]MCG7406586.1 DUF2290 domain-containing protein [Paenibacillus sp. ACRRX]
MSRLTQQLYNEVTEVTSQLIDFSLSIDQNFPSIRKNDKFDVIDWGKSDNLSIVFKNIEYNSIYNELYTDRNFNIKMVDGTLIQLMYMVYNDKLVSHRLAVFPNPYLEQFQNEPEIYEKEDLYADILAKSIVPIPIRFDYNEDMHDEYHAKSHASFGQYKNCRIPVHAPITPTAFVDFILRNFYSNAYRNFNNLRKTEIELERTISIDEEKLIHFNMTL